MVDVVSTSIEQSDSTISDSNSKRIKNEECVCGIIPDRPNIWDKVETARWMVHNIDWGVLTTISSRTIKNDDDDKSSTGSKYYDLPIPFGNVYSFIDGSCTNATGIPYFYGTYMDQSLQDMKSNSMASFTLSEASVRTSCMQQHSSSSSSDTTKNPIRQACRIVPESSLSQNTFSTSTSKNKQHYDYIHHDTTESIKTTASTTTTATTTAASVSESGDPESPICARLTLTGMLEPLSINSIEYDTIQEAFYIRHPQMQYWPMDHNWIIFKLNIIDVWIIDYFGGATILTPEQYFHS